MEVLLASKSPRRRQLLALIFDEFRSVTSDFNESTVKEQNPEELVKRLSYCKAKAVFGQRDQLVIGADTVVVSPENKVFGIPPDESAAYEMLQTLSGKKHRVMTGVTLLYQGEAVTFCSKTDVYFRPLEEEEIRDYIRSGEPFDKAGGYGIQGKAAVFVEKIDGDFYNVMGLPVTDLYMAVQRLVRQK
ncbi:MAG: Maf family protein [Clostridiales bacterium]|nr:Maf family protein [Clostridiales bacterium]